MTSIRSPQQLGDALRAARKLQADPGHRFAGNAMVEQINTLIEQRCTLTIQRLTDPAAEYDEAAKPSI